jgi:hypothetical protein
MPNALLAFYSLYLPGLPTGFDGILALFFKKINQ